MDKIRRDSTCSFDELFSAGDTPNASAELSNIEYYAILRPDKSIYLWRGEPVIYMTESEALRVARNMSPRLLLRVAKVRIIEAGGRWALEACDDPR